MSVQGKNIVILDRLRFIFSTTIVSFRRLIARCRSGVLTTAALASCIRNQPAYGRIVQTWKITRARVRRSSTDIASESRPRINFPKAQRRMSRGQKIGIVSPKSFCDTSFGIAMRRRFNTRHVPNCTRRQSYILSKNHNQLVIVLRCISPSYKMRTLQPRRRNPMGSSHRSTRVDVRCPKSRLLRSYNRSPRFLKNKVQKL